MIIDSIGQTVHPLVYLPRTPFFTSFLWITRFLWRKREKVQNSYPIPFSILHMSTNFHYDRTNNKKVFFLSTVLKILWFCDIYMQFSQNPQGGLGSKILLVLGTIWGCCGQIFSMLARMIIDSIGQIVHPLVYLPRTPFFTSFLWITRFLWRKREKVQNSYPIPFSILHMSTNFHYDRTNNKKVFFLSTVLKILWFCDIYMQFSQNPQGGLGSKILLVLGTIWGCCGQIFSLLARTSVSRPILAKMHWTIRVLLHHFKKRKAVDVILTGE